MNTTAKRSSNDDMSEMMIRNPQVLSKSYTSTVVDIYLDGEIGSPEKYRETYHALSNAGPQDLIALHINSVGGRLDAGIQLINHIKNCKAKVIGILHMECASMASAIFLACDDWELNSFSTMMVHSCSYGAAGKQSDIRSRVEFTTAFNERYIRENYAGFLTEEEIDRALKGDDIYFNAEQIEDKLESFKAYRDKLEDEAAAEELGQIIEKAEVKKSAPKAQPRKTQKSKS
jgi:ATP-dependent protease ClpP protease subunit